jgi:hypothetical protein
VTPEAALLPLAIALLVFGSAEATATLRPPVAQHHRVRRHPARHVARRRTRHFSVEIRDEGGRDVQSYASRSPGQLHLRPSVDTRFGGGAVASFGYHPGVVAPTLGPHELNGAAEPRLGHSESSAGVTVKVPL